MADHGELQNCYSCLNAINLPQGRHQLRFTGKPPFTWKMAQFISYLRVSTHKQGYSGLGVEAQRQAVDAYLKSVGGELLAEFVEVESGARKVRPVLVQSIALCRQMKATLIIAKLDRLARNVAFVSSLMESGIEFVAADAPYANRLMIHILAAFAEHEREQISTRTKLALAAAKSRGAILGANGVKLAESNRREALAFATSYRPIIEAILATGSHTLVQIAARLDNEGHRTRDGAQWSASTVHRLLSRLGIKR